MKIKILLTLILVMILVIQLQARKHGEFDIEKHLEHLTEVLDLTAKQQEEIFPFLKEQQSLMERFDPRKSSRSEREEFRKQMEEIRDKIDQILNEKQQQRFAQMQEQMRRPNGQNPSRNN